MYNSYLYKTQRYVYKKIFPSLSLIFSENQVRNSRAIKFNQFLTQCEGYEKTQFNIILKKKNLNTFYNLIPKCVEEFNYKPEQLQKYLNEEKSEILSPGEWNELSMYLVSIGMFKTSEICRMHSYNSFYKYKSRYLLLKQSLCLNMTFDAGKIDQARKIFQEHFKKLTYSQNIIYSKLLTNKKVGTLISNEFFDLINGKNIAVIGPLDKDVSINREYDLIVKINPIIKSNNKTISNIKNADIAYYSNGALSLINNDKEKYIPSDLKYVIHKNQLHEGSKMPNRRMLNDKDICWNGCFNLLQSTLCDLLLFDPKYIKVFNSDLYITLNYSDNHISNLASLNKYYTSAFSGHDLMTQFNFTKNLYKLGLIDADENLKHILKYSLSEYLTKMEQIYPFHLNSELIER